jgi:glycosyltransferase involved in cell wall biosynthesis
MTNTPDPRDFYRAAKLMLVPSLCQETLARVPIEAMLNGIPVLASRRGALSETVGENGYVFDVPARYTPATRAVPSAEEVGHWLETIERLWDDTVSYGAASEKGRLAATKWQPERLLPRFESFFVDVAQGRAARPLANQPGAPIPTSARSSS